MSAVLLLVPALAYSPTGVLKAQWESSGAFIGFSTDMYADMVNDAPRTKGFEQAIQRRLRCRAGECVVLDIGTGPFAILALFAARAGARKVYAVEANAEAAEQARATVAAAVARGEIDPGTIEVISGFSTAITLPEPADLLVAEISGSVATEEGMCHSVRDARLRHMARPNDPASYIPARCQTVVAPASYCLNHRCETDEAALTENSWPMHDVEARAGPRLAGEPEYPYRCIQDVHQYVGVGPVRVQCTDPWLLALSAPQLWEDIVFGGDELPPGPGRHSPPAPLVFRVTAAEIEANGRRFAAELELQGVGAELAAQAARGAARSLCGFACWPRLVLDEGEGDEPPIIVQSRGMAGEPRESHWQTVLPLLGTPAVVKAGDEISVQFTMELDVDIGVPPSYEITATVNSM